MKTYTDPGQLLGYGWGDLGWGCRRGTIACSVSAKVIKKVCVKLTCIKGVGSCQPSGGRSVLFPVTLGINYKFRVFTHYVKVAFVVY